MGVTDTSKERKLKLHAEMTPGEQRHPWDPAPDTLLNLGTWLAKQLPEPRPRASPAVCLGRAQESVETSPRGDGVLLSFKVRGAQFPPPPPCGCREAAVRSWKIPGL